MAETKIEWTGTFLKDPVKWKGELTKVLPGYTFNPWWGCLKVSEECENCYAEYLSDVRYKNNFWGPAKTTERRMFADKHWNEPLLWNAQATAAGVKLKVFCASMADVFEYNPKLNESRLRLWRLIEGTPNLIWLLLTKRPQNINLMIPEAWRKDPQPNVWYGTSVGLQKNIEVIDSLLEVEAPVRFLSCEPLLGPLSLEDQFPMKYMWNEQSGKHFYSQIDWVIVGGESGNKARPMNPRWVSRLQQECANAKVPFFFKQWGEYHTTSYDMTDKTAHFREFTDKQHWINKGDTWVRGGVCLSLDGKLLKRGLDFDHCAYPVVVMDKVGKKNAGRELNGKIYNEMPAV